MFHLGRWEGGWLQVFVGAKSRPSLEGSYCMYCVYVHTCRLRTNAAAAIARTLTWCTVSRTVRTYIRQGQANLPACGEGCRHFTISVTLTGSFIPPPAASLPAMASFPEICRPYRHAGGPIPRRLEHPYQLKRLRSSLGAGKDTIGSKLCSYLRGWRSGRGAP